MFKNLIIKKKFKKLKNTLKKIINKAVILAANTKFNSIILK